MNTLNHNSSNHNNITQVKICGIKTLDILNAAISSGARFIGFVFYPPSPRHIDIDTAKELTLMLPTGVRAVGLFVNPTDEQLDIVTGRVQLDMLQLHGNETPERVKQIKDKYTLPIIKAFPISTEKDIEQIHLYENIVDWLLFDNISGGSGKKFDWSLLENQQFFKPWMLSGGLNPDNVAKALNILSPNAVDVSSGVESARGIKDPQKVKTFIRAVQNHSQL